MSATDSPNTTGKDAGPLARMAEAGRAYAVVSEVTRDPNPAPTHAYKADPQSGAGNCTCGMAEHHRRHPHEFLAAASDPSLCVCALLPEALPHQHSQKRPCRHEESLWGRCTACGMTWEQQTAERARRSER